MIRTTLALICLAAPAMADRIQAEASCTPLPAEQQYRCDILLTAAGSPLEGAAFTVKPDMPSMPMAHNLRPVDATATDTPGTYSADIHLEMWGDWTLTLDLSAPRRDRVVLSYSFEKPASETRMINHADHSGHAEHSN